MDVKEYISTGILEAYLLGDVTAEERVEVEHMLEQHPELRAELKKAEATLEAFVMKASIQPRTALKEKILETVNPGARMIAMRSSFTAWRYAAAASIVIALFAGYQAISYHSKWVESQTALDQLIAQNKQVVQDYSVVNQKLDKIQRDLAVIENSSFQRVVMKGTDHAKDAQASVYWNASTNEAYLSIQNLKTLSKEQQFQLWAIVQGKPIDAGVFDVSTGLLKMKNIANAAAFAVTVEPRGGKKSPSLETMQVVGNVKG